LPRDSCSSPGSAVSHGLPSSSSSPFLGPSSLFDGVVKRRDKVRRAPDVCEGHGCLAQRRAWIPCGACARVYRDRCHLLPHRDPPRFALLALLAPVAPPCTPPLAGVLDRACGLENTRRDPVDVCACISRGEIHAPAERQVALAQHPSPPRTIPSTSSLHQLMSASRLPGLVGRGTKNQGTVRGPERKLELQRKL